MPLGRRRIQRSLHDRLVSVPAEACLEITRRGAIEDLEVNDLDSIPRQQIVEIVQQRADDCRGAPWGGLWMDELQIRLPVEPAKRRLGFGILLVIWVFEQAAPGHASPVEDFMQPFRDALTSGRTQAQGRAAGQLRKLRVEIRFAETYEIGFGNLVVEKVSEVAIRTRGQQLWGPLRVP